MIKSKRSAGATFSLLLTRDGDAPQIDWCTVRKVVKSWGQENGVEILDAPSGSKQETPEATLRMLIRFKNNTPVMPIAARLYRQLYELSVNLELDK